MIARALEISPDDPEVLVSKVKLLQTTGDLPAARAVLARIPPGADQWTGGRSSIQAVALGRKLRRSRQAGGKPDRETEIEGTGRRRVFPAATRRCPLVSRKSRRRARSVSRSQSRASKRFGRSNRKVRFLPIDLAFTEAGLGNKEAALREGARAVSLLPAKEDPVFGPGMEENLAAVEAQVGEIESALARIERLLTTPYGAFPITQATLRLDPIWKPLRSHPRFLKIVESQELKTAYD